MVSIQLVCPSMIRVLNASRDAPSVKTVPYALNVEWNSTFNPMTVIGVGAGVRPVHLPLYVCHVVRVTT